MGKVGFIFCALLLVGCGKTYTAEEYDEMVSSKDQEITTLQEENTKLKEHIENLEIQTQEVNEQFDRFKSENWRDVVPAAQNSIDGLNNVVENNPDN